MHPDGTTKCEERVFNKAEYNNKDITVLGLSKSHHLRCGSAGGARIKRGRKKKTRKKRKRKSRKKRKFRKRKKTKKRRKRRK